MDKVCLAFDLGASNGRLVLGRFDERRIALEEIHRFPNEPVWFRGRLYWDFFRLFHEIKLGLKKAAQMGEEIASIGVDCWGVDFGYLDRRGELLANPAHYRDDRGRGMRVEIEKDTSVHFQDIYSITGIQDFSFNTLYQFYYDTKYRPELVEQAEALLFMPDLFSYGLTGVKCNEYTIASTSQMLDARGHVWAADLLRRIGLPVRLLQPIIQPGTVWGRLSAEVREELGLPALPVVAVGSHDTASAVAAAPLCSERSAFLSCGSWSLLGMEITEPQISASSLAANFTNEGGVEGTIRYLNNINGLWIIQELRKKWCRSLGEISFGQISNAAREAEHITYHVEPSEECFVAPFDMEEAVLRHCRERLGVEPTTVGETTRAVYNGIVLEYKRTIESLEETLNLHVDCINMVGGGTQDEFLCQLTADVTGKPVLAGPVEASVLGNILMQLKALGCIASVQEGRELIRESFTIKEYLPKVS